MKTAIEQMMEDLNDTFPRFFNVHSAEGRVFMGIATKYLTVEKEQIIKACDAGFDTANLFIEDMKYKNAEDYYEKTYGGNK
jgi:hypothetical protein